MRRLEIEVYEPGDSLATLAADGTVRLWTVFPDGTFAQGKVLQPPPITGATPIDELNFSVRTYNLVKREGIDTVSGLLEWWDRLGREGLNDIRNMGTSQADEVEAKVRQVRGAAQPALQTAPGAQP